MKKLKNTVGAVAVLAIALFGLYNKVIGKAGDGESREQQAHASSQADGSVASDGLAASADGVNAQAVGLPQMKRKCSEQIIEHVGYTVSYNADNRIPNWVAWMLTPSRFVEVVSRSNDFMPDPAVRENAVTTADYKKSGYDRGHMCPAADNRWRNQAMVECFYMTNICPQNHNLNRGDWKELEEACRDWTMQYDTLHVACGPILYKKEKARIGVHRVLVPDAFFKVVLRLKPVPSAIGFIYKNTSGNKPLDSYINSIDEVERITGIDFFSQLPDAIEDAVEAQCNVDDWQRK